MPVDDELQRFGNAKKNINFLNISKKKEPATKNTQENRNSDKAVRVKLFANSL